MNLAHQCFRLALANNNSHAEAYNNLAVLEMRKGHAEQVGALRGRGGRAASFRAKLSRVASLPVIMQQRAVKSDQSGFESSSATC